MSPDNLGLPYLISREALCSMLLVCVPLRPLFTCTTPSCPLDQQHHTPTMEMCRGKVTSLVAHAAWGMPLWEVNMAEAFCQSSKVVMGKSRFKVTSHALRNGFGCFTS